MLEMRYPSCRPLQGLLQARRHGSGVGAAGVIVKERIGRRFVQVIARQAKAAEVVTVASSVFGLTPPGASRYVANGDLAFIWAGLGQWVVDSAEDRTPDLFAELTDCFRECASVVDQTDGWEGFYLSGPRLRDALAKAVAIDLHPRVFRPGDVALTVVGGMNVHLWQIDHAPTFALIAYRSVAGSLWEWLREAASEYGVEVIK